MSLSFAEFRMLEAKVHGRNQASCCLSTGCLCYGYELIQVGPAGVQNSHFHPVSRPESAGELSLVLLCS